MRTVRHATLGTLLLALATGALACSLETATEPDAEWSEVTLNTPSWSRGAARDTSFANAYPFRFFSGATTAQRSVLRSQAQWIEVWNVLQQWTAPLTAPPAVDFTTEMVVFVSLGARSSGGYSTAIRHVTMVSDTLWVLLTERQPGPTCLVLSALTQPTDVRVVPRTDAPVRFRTRQEMLDCR